MTLKGLRELESLSIHQFACYGLIGLTHAQLIVNHIQVIPRCFAKTMHEFTQGKFNGSGVLLNSRDFSTSSCSCRINVLHELFSMESKPQNDQVVCVQKDDAGNSVTNRITIQSALRVHNPQIHVNSYTDFFL